MVVFFLRRHYPLNVVMSADTRARNVPRVAALTESVRVTDGSRPRAVMTYHPHNLPIKRIIMDKWQILQEDEDTRETFPVPPFCGLQEATEHTGQCGKISPPSPLSSTTGCQATSWQPTLWKAQLQIVSMDRQKIEDSGTRRQIHCKQVFLVPDVWSCI